MAKYQICFGREETGQYVEYRNGNILVDSLAEQVEHLRPYYNGKLWLKLVEEKKEISYSDIETWSWGGPGA